MSNTKRYLRLTTTRYFGILACKRSGFSVYMAPVLAIENHRRPMYKVAEFIYTVSDNDKIPSGGICT